jgi:hypothetical protein
MLLSSARNWWGQQPQDTPTAPFHRFMRVARTSKKLLAVAAAGTATNYAIRNRLEKSKADRLHKAIASLLMTRCARALAVAADELILKANGSPLVL